MILFDFIDRGTARQTGLRPTESLAAVWLAIAPITIVYVVISAGFAAVPGT